MADPFSPVTAVVTGEMNAKNAREEQKRSHRYNKELMQLSYGYGQQEQLNAARNTRAGLIAAGINPAIQDGGTFAPASGPSALTSTPAPNRYPNFESPLSGLLQMSNLQAQTDNIKAQTEKTKLENEKTLDENVTSQGLAVIQLEKMAADLPDSALETKARLQALADLAKNRGSLAALTNFAHMLDEHESYNARAIQNRLQKVVTEYQLDDKHGKDGHSIIADLASLPSAQFSQLWSSSMDLLRHAEWLQSQKGMTDEEKKLKIEQTKLTASQIENLKEVTQRIKDTNLMKIAEGVGEGTESPWKLLAAIAFLLFSNTSVSIR